MEASLIFKEYEVEEIIYKVNTLTNVDEENLNPELMCNILHPKNDNSTFIVKVGLEFGDNYLKESNTYLKCIVSGLFQQDNYAGIDLTPNAVAILFPYLRSLISDVTSKGSKDPIILPPINVEAFLKTSEKTEEEI